MSSPDITQREIDAVSEVLRTRFLSIGPQLEAFEREFASYVGASYAVGVNSGTSGLHLSILAAGVGEGDVVLTTPFSFIASSNCILYAGAEPVFVDVDPGTGNMDPDKAFDKVSQLVKVGRSVRAILPVHVFGQPADMEPILDLAEEFGLVVIEDACEAIGAEYKGRKAGSLGDVAVFAFYPNKQMTTGEGGMIVTNRSDWDALFRSLRNQGRDIFDEWLTHSRLGYNYRLDEMSAALGLTQLGRIEELLEKRSSVAEWYNERLSELQEFIDLPYVAPSTTKMSWFVYVVRVKPPLERNIVMKKLAEFGIPSRPYFVPIHLQPYYRKLFGYKRGDFPITEYLGDVSLALPFSSVMRESDVDMVCEYLTKVIKGQ